MNIDRFRWRTLAVAAAAMATVIAAACGDDTPAATPETIIQTVVVTQPAEVVQETVVVTQAPVQQTVVVRETSIVQQTVVVEATPTPAPETFFGIPIPTAGPSSGQAPAPKSASGNAVIRTGLELRASGMPGDQEGQLLGMSVTEKFFLTDNGGNAVNQVIDSWDLAADLSSVTFVLKQNVPFHGGFGNLTADDVAWSYNNSNPGFNPVSATDGGANWVGFLGGNEVIAVDDRTVRFDIANFDVRWDVFLFGQSGLGASIVSHQAFIQNDEDWMRDHVIGTGPFSVDLYSRDDIVELSAVKPHHRATPSVDTLTYRAIPDVAVAEAALRVGDVDIMSGPINLRNVGPLTDEGFITLDAGAGSFESVSFTGNYWEATHYDTGEPISSDAHAARPQSPWMGVPSVPASMESSKIVRKALSHAIDRDLIAEVLTGGAGWSVYLYGTNPQHPNWQDKWNVPYDQDLAEQMLDEAGYPRNSNGIRFEMPFFIRLGRGDEEVGTAVVGMWREIGIDMQDWKAQYQTYRPGLISRSNVAPWVHSAGAESPQAPWHWPVMGNTECSRGRGAFNVGVEMAEMCAFFDSMSAEPDPQVRLGIRDAHTDWLFEWNPIIGTIAVPQVALANPNKVASWDMPISAREAQIHHPEFLVLK